MQGEGTPPIPRPGLASLQAAAASLLGTAVEIIEPLSGGARRDTYRVIDETGARSVLRLDRDAASLEKEVALTLLVRGRVPVAAIVGADLTGELVGVPLTVSAYAEGESLDAALAGAGDDDASALGEVVGRTLATIGTIVFDAPGPLGPALRPEPFDVPLPGLLVETGDRVLGEAAARSALGDPVADGYRALLQEAAPALEAVADETALVHSDFNGKNLVLARGPAGAPVVSAVLDWEFAFAGPPLADVGNMLRRQERMPAAFVDRFVASFAEHGGGLPAGWRSIAAALDALALLDFLDRGTRGEHGAGYTEACSLIEEAVARGDLARPAPA
jgi:aminoglycoside phosphotransferase (APT) family kinase protein